jgi:CRISPR-associated protein Cmr4
MTKPELIGLLAQTHVHVGVGQSTEALDLPVAREKTTQWPFVPGSGVKGAFRVWAREQAGLANIGDLFGKEDADAGNDGNAGGLMFSDARLLLLPVRALNKAWRWVTSPGLLRRWQRDRERCGETVAWQVLTVEQGKWLGEGEDKASLGLEEREFERADEAGVDLCEDLAGLTGESAGFVTERLVILHDDDFVWFARYGLPIMARNALDENKRVKRGALWYEESLAPDTLLYLLLGERKAGSLAQFSGKLSAAPHVQMGGNETIGQGWFRITRGGENDNG